MLALIPFAVGTLGLWSDGPSSSEDAYGALTDERFRELHDRLGREMVEKISSRMGISPEEALRRMMASPKLEALMVESIQRQSR